MPFHPEWVFLFYIFDIAIGLFFTLAILGIKKGRKETRLILAGLIFLFCLMILTTIVDKIRVNRSCNVYEAILLQFYFLIGPFLLFYVKSLTTPDFRFKKKYLFHTVPFCLSVIYSTMMYTYVYTSEVIQFGIEARVEVITRFITLLIYLVITKRHMDEHDRNIKASHSSIEKIRLVWIRYLLLGVASLLVLYLVFPFFYKYFQGYALFSSISKFMQIWEPVLICFLGYKGLTQPEIFSETNDYETNKKSKSSPLSKSQAEQYLNKLLQYMEAEKPYLDSELTLRGLAERLDMSPRRLSQVINEWLNQNFFDFINQYRVEEAKNRLIQPENQKYSILGIAFDAGFNSKSSFNLVFKNFVKMTPSQYQKHAMKSR